MNCILGLVHTAVELLVQMKCVEKMAFGDKLIISGNVISVG